MRKWYNSTTHEWYIEGTSIKRDLDNGVFTGIPSVEQLKEWGFEEYIAPAPTLEQLLQQAKNVKLADLETYDLSDAVDSFTINDMTMWLTVDERQQIATQIAANEAAGRTYMTRWFGGIPFTFPLTLWQQMLTALEVYAGDAINVTEAHAAAINALTSVEEVEAYQFTGYPQKLVFTAPNSE